MRFLAAAVSALVALIAAPARADEENPAPPPRNLVSATLGASYSYVLFGDDGTNEYRAPGVAIGASYARRLLSSLDLGLSYEFSDLPGARITTHRISAQARVFALLTDDLELGFTVALGPMFASREQQSFRGLALGAGLDARYWVTPRLGVFVRPEVWGSKADRHGPSEPYINDKGLFLTAATVAGATMRF